MRPVFLLVHGWGFDATFWAPLQNALSGADCVSWNLGFRGAPSRPPLPVGRPVVAVGHSYGLLWLLCHRPVAWKWLVSINGFPRFTRQEDFPAGVAPRVLGRMIGRFAEAPDGVYTDFMQRCGVSEVDLQGLDRAALLEGLTTLAEADGRPARIDLALAGRADPIAPPSLTADAFAGQTIHWHEGGHLLPLEDPDWCAERLRALAGLTP